MTCPRPHSSKWHIGTYTQVCPPARSSKAHFKGWKQALPPPSGSLALLSFHDITCQNHSLGRKDSFYR